jgi:hypothetical protein
MSFPVTKDRDDYRSSDDPKIRNCDNLLWVTIDDLFMILKELGEITKCNVAVIEKLVNRVSELEKRLNLTSH